jgi:hypothetical protein
MSIEKRLALKLVRHAAFVLPRPLSSWGAAMRHEIEYIQPNRDALKWAAGCVSSSYGRRIASLNVVQMVILRWMLALFIASWAIGDFFAARFLYLKTVGWLGLRIGSASVSFISAVSELPSWLIMVDGIGGVLYVVAAYCLTQKKVSSVWVLIVATVVNSTACVSQILLALQRYGPASSMDSVRHTCFTYALQSCVILLLWHGFAANRGRASA